MLIKRLIDSFNKNIPGLIHECPYYGLTSMTDININDILSPLIPQVVPTGTYKGSFLFTNLKQPNLTYAFVEVVVVADAIDIMKRMNMG